MTTYLGHKGFLGVGVESSWGTQASISKYLLMNSESFNAAEGRGHSASINSINMNLNRMYKQGITAGGDTAVDIRYDGFELLFKNALGSCSTTGISGSIYQSTFTIADALPTGLTYEVYRDLTSFYLIGGKINTLGLSLDTEGVLVGTVGLVGKDLVTGAVSSATPTYPTTDLAIFSQGQVTWGGSSVDVTNFNLTLNNNLDVGRRFLGSRYIKEPIRGGKIEVTGSLGLEFTDYAMVNDFRNATNRALVLSFTGGVIGATASYYQLNIYCNVAVLTNANPTINNEGRILYNADFKTYLSGSDAELKIIAQNTVSTVA